MIINENDRKNNDKILVPDSQVHFEGDISNLVGHVFVKNSKKIPIEFNEKILKKLRHARQGSHIREEKEVALTYADLTKNKYGKAEGLLEWWIPKEEQDTLKPAGCYIASNEPENTYVKTAPRCGVKGMYTEPLIDAWTRQLKQPIIIVNDVLTEPDVSKLNKRHYQTNVIANSKSGSAIRYKFIDFLPYIFQCFLQKQDTACLNYLNSLVKSLFNESSPLKFAFYGHQFIFSVLMYFEHLQTELEYELKHTKNLAQQIAIYDKYYKKSTLNELNKFMQNVLSKPIEKADFQKLVNFWKLNLDENTESPSTFTAFVLLAQNYEGNKLSTNEAQMIINMGNIALQDAMFYDMRKQIKTIILAQTTDYQNPLIIDPYSFTTGRQLTLKFDDLKENDKIVITDGEKSMRADLNNNKITMILLDQFKDSSNITIKTPNNDFDLSFFDPDCSLPENVQLVSTNLQYSFTKDHQIACIDLYKYFRPLYLQISGVFYKKYSNFIIDMMYQSTADIAYSNNCENTKRPVKYLLDMDKMVLDIEQLNLDRFPLYLTAGLGQNIQFTIIDYGELSKYFNMDVIKANCNEIKISNIPNNRVISERANKFEVAYGHYQQYSNMPYWLAYEFLLKSKKDSNKTLIPKQANKMRQTFEDLIHKAQQ